MILKRKEAPLQQPFRPHPTWLALLTVAGAGGPTGGGAGRLGRRAAHDLGPNLIDGAQRAGRAALDDGRR